MTREEAFLEVLIWIDNHPDEFKKMLDEDIEEFKARLGKTDILSITADIMLFYKVNMMVDKKLEEKGTLLEKMILREER